jgi:hypothetical protein
MLINVHLCLQYTNIKINEGSKIKKNKFWIGVYKSKL